MVKVCAMPCYDITVLGLYVVLGYFIVHALFYGSWPYVLYYDFDYLMIVDNVTLQLTPLIDKLSPMGCGAFVPRV